jgi:glycosyltransferase involved in cell wall biosynthesis
VIEGHNIICFSNDWDGDPLSKKHIMLRLASKNRVLWVNSIGARNPTISAGDLRRILKKLRDIFQGCRRVSDNIYVLPPIVLPFHRNSLMRSINRKCLRWSLRMACRRLGFRNPITWTFVPSSALVAGALGEQLIVYHCVDEFSEFSGTDKAATLELERALMEKSDAVIVSSSRLYDTKRRYNRNTFLVTHGVDVGHFRKACNGQIPVPADISALRSPVIGFYGLIADWIDFQLIRFLAKSRPDWSIALVGKVETNTDLSLLEGLPNVHLLGRKDYQQLPGYCKAFDAAILPFVLNELTLAANPLKLREYLAAGLPVVATAIPEAERLSGLVRIGRTFPHFLEQIQALLAEGKTGPQLAVSQAMETESWDEKVEQLSRIIIGLKRTPPLPTAAKASEQAV